ncbi:MAG: 50S ribosomal protein L23 [Candidatus Micrarchaeota archaeon]|nr:MAG: 50S ribosomal protein L23 [Candidatus Micrarchaeota archaeon]
MSVLLYPLNTEKAISLIDKANTITFIVADAATKKQVKEEFERLFKVKVKSVNISNTFLEGKKAYIKLEKDYKASDIAVKLKLA